MFQLTATELRNCLGVAMLSSVLNSDRAIKVNITIMRVFDRLRGLLAKDPDLAAQVAKHERRLDEHDLEIAALMESVPQLPPPPEPKPVIGFTPAQKKRPD